MLGPEVNPAARAEFGLLSDHAGGYPLHIRNLGTAQAERIAHAGLLLVGGVGPADRGPHPQRGSQDDSTPQFDSQVVLFQAQKHPCRPPNHRRLKFWVSNMVLASGCALALRREGELPTWNR